MYVPPLDMPLEEVRSELDKLRGPLSIAIQRAKNPFNVGAIIRVAHSFLVKEIFLIGDEPYYKRASMGMEKYEHIRNVPDEAAFLAEIGDTPLVVLEKDHASQGLWQCDMPQACCLVFGSEDFGVGEEILQAAHTVVGIPMYGINHSYPVTVAAGIAMAEWARRHAAVLYR